MAGESKKTEHADQPLFTAQLNGGEEFSITGDQLNTLDLVFTGNGRFHMLADSRAYNFELLHADYLLKEYIFSCQGEEIRIKLRDRIDELVHRMGFEMNGEAIINELNAPMPGMVLKVLVEPGKKVSKGETLLILEAMKMENVLTAPGDCTVAEVLVTTGETVEKGQKLIILDQ